MIKSESDRGVTKTGGVGRVGKRQVQNCTKVGPDQLGPPVRVGS